MVSQGNIDPSRMAAVSGAVVVKLPNGRAVVIPTVVGGRALTPEQAIQHFQQTGEHLGVFADAASAGQFASAVQQQAQSR
jgi:hypothetical protein